MAPRVERLTGAREHAALAYLDRTPFENVYLDNLVRTASAAFRGGLHVALDGDRICGVAYFGRQIILAAEMSALPALANAAAPFRGERMIVGPREQIRLFWEIVRPTHVAPRHVRDRQYVMAVDGTSLRDGAYDIVVRRARVDDLAAVTESSAAMIRHELEYDPRAENPNFEGSVRLALERGLWWIAESEGRLCFFCSAGARSPRTLQLQSIWTPPHMRGRGFATAALAGICRTLLRETPTLSLYVNDFNIAAITLYERLGFERVGEFMTLLF